MTHMSQGRKPKRYPRRLVLISEVVCIHCGGEMEHAQLLPMEEYPLLRLECLLCHRIATQNRRTDEVTW